MDRTQALIVRAQQGDKAASEQLVLENAGLIWSIARRYFGRGVEPDDLYQLGALGFLKAIVGFDTQYGTQFSTYAVPKIAGEIRRFLRDDGAVKVSRSVKERAAVIKKERQRLTGELGREPTPEEIAEEMNMPVDRVREILKISQEPVSLETPIGEEEDSHLGDFIQDDNVPVPSDAAAFTLLKEQLVEVLGTLTEREQKVLRLRFGLDDGRARTLEEVGKEFNVTRERIRQIEAKALRKLRHPSRSRKLKDYLD